MAYLKNIISIVAAVISLYQLCISGERFIVKNDTISSSLILTSALITGMISGIAFNINSNINAGVCVLIVLISAISVACEIITLDNDLKNNENIYYLMSSLVPIIIWTFSWMFMIGIIITMPINKTNPRINTRMTQQLSFQPITDDSDSSLASA